MRDCLQNTILPKDVRTHAVGLALAGVFACANFGVLSAEVLRPPCVPIVSCDPFFSIWMPREDPTAADTEIWYGAKQPIGVQVELDGIRYRLLGSPAAIPDGRNRGEDIPALKCTGCEVRPLTTVFSYSDGRIQVELSFMTPKLADDLDVFSRPVTYAEARAVGASSVRFFVEISPALATNDDAAEMVTNRLAVAGKTAVRIGRKVQKPLSMDGDRVRCDWGYAYLVNPESEGAEARFLLAYDDIETFQFLGDNLRAWWRRDGKGFAEMLETAERDTVELWTRAKSFDREFTDRMTRVGGPKYAALAALAYRQSFAACSLVAGKNGNPFLFSKENTSNGCAGTVDVLYPQLPLLLISSSRLTRAALEPVFEYATSGKWPYPYAPHDVGRYPLGNGQVYRMPWQKNPHTGKPYLDDAERMPVEECGNMIIGVCALTEAEGSVAFAEMHRRVLTSWAEYLARVGYDPADQLCTDDFAGRLAHNANLSVKTIIAFAAYARMANRLGDSASAARFSSLAKESVSKWMAAARGGLAGGYRLAFDRPGTWSMKYNLVWDRVFGLGLFPAEVAEAEMRVYRQVARPFGVPLDCRKEYTKTDWEFWVASLSGKRKDLDFVTHLVWRYANETPDRNPFPDFYWANNCRVRGFLGRSVIGGIFMPVLADGLMSKDSR